MKNNNLVRQARLPRGAYKKGLGEIIAPFMKPDPDRLNWHAMKFNLCPKCGEDFVFGIRVEEMSVPNDQMFIHKCGFKIRESKYQKIVSSQVQDRIDRSAAGEEDENV